MVFSKWSRRGQVRRRPAVEALEQRLNLSVFTVTTASSLVDGRSTGPFGWTGPDGELSFGEAVAAAQSTAGPHTVRFDIQGPLPAAGFWTLSLSTDFFGANPSVLVRNQTTIDGYSQPGASANTSASGDNAKILIQLADLVVVQSTGNTIKGLSIAAIDIGSFGLSSPDDDNVIAGNFIGLDPKGKLLPQVGTHGARIYAQQTEGRNRIGGTAAADRNVIAGGPSTGVGIELAGSSNNGIRGNFIGVRPGGPTTAAWEQDLGDTVQGDFTNVDSTGASLGFSLVGVLLSSVGGSTSAGNYIAGNAIASAAINGVRVIAGAGNVISGNAIFNNGTSGDGGAGIALTSGGNNDAVAPVLTNVTATEISGTLSGPANSQAFYFFEFFANDGRDASGQLEGQRFLDASQVSLNFDATGQAAFTIPLILSEADIANLSVTAADLLGNTSPFPGSSQASVTLEANSNLPAFIEGTLVKKKVLLASFASDDPQARSFTAEVDWGGGVDALAQPANVKVRPSGRGRYRIEARNIQYRKVDLLGTSRTIEVTVRDAAGRAIGNLQQETNVIDAQLVAGRPAFDGGKKQVEGQPVTAALLFLDRNPFAVLGEHTATIDWGDGVTTAATIRSPGSPFKRQTFEASGEHAYEDTGKYTVTVTVVNNDPSHPCDNPSSVTASATLRVSDAPIEISPITPRNLGPDKTLHAGTLLADFTDENLFEKTENYNILVSWGDRSPLDFFGGTVTKLGQGSYRVHSASDHVYAENGTYTLVLTIIDEAFFVSKLQINVGVVA